MASFGTALVDRLVDFSGGVLKEARTIVTESMMTTNQAIEGSLNFGKESLDFGRAALIASPSTSQAAGSTIASTQNVSSLKNVYLIAAVGAVALIFLLKRK